jgi:protein-tyrosine phosphatase
MRRHPVSSVLMICNGNICRSPFAERALARARPDLQIASAGFTGAGRAVPEHGLVAAALHGIDLSGHRAQVITSSLIFEANLIVVMDERQQRAICRRFGRWESDVLLLGDCDPDAEAVRAIADPVLQPLAAFHACYARILSCVDTLADAVTGRAAGAEAGAGAGATELAARFA